MVMNRHMVPFGLFPNLDQASMNMEDYLKTLDFSLGGFLYISGYTFSLYLPEQDEYYDITFDSPTPYQNGGGFS